MRDITHKPETLRTAVATALLTSVEPVEDLLARARDDKGDALEIARVAGVMGAQRTWETIPYCHQIPVTHARVTYAITDTTIRVEMSCTTIAATGCEVEAMTGASIAALTLYDVLKPHTDDLRIDDIRLLQKRGGKSDTRVTLDPPARVALIATDDRVLAGTKEPTAVEQVLALLEPIASVALTRRPDAGQRADEATEAIQSAVDAGFEIVLTVGGTGVQRADTVPAAAAALFDRPLPGLMEAARGYGQRRTPLAMLSNGVAGIIGDTLVITLPGSTDGARETAQALFPAALKVVANLRAEAPNNRRP